jgi:hypothetical protein
VSYRSGSLRLPAFLFQQSSCLGSSCQLMIIALIHIPLKIMQQGSSADDLQIGSLCSPNDFCQPADPLDVGKAVHRIFFRVKLSRPFNGQHELLRLSE